MKYLRRSLQVGSAVLFSCWFLAQPAFATPAWDLVGVSGFRNGSWAFGELFTVGSQNITINALGVLDGGKNGFATSTGLPVGIYSEVGYSLLASATVNSSDTLVGNYRFHTIAPITLLAGQSYRVVGVNLFDEYNIAFNPNMIVDPRITWNGYAYGSSATLQVLNTFTGKEISWFANFNIASSASVPDGGATSVMLGMALVGFMTVGRRLAFR